MALRAGAVRGVERVRWSPTRTRIALVGVGGLVLALLGGHVFDAAVPELVIVPVAVTVAALLTAGAGRTWRLGACGLAVVVSVVAAVLVTGGSWSDVVPGIRFGPRRLLSTEWPSPLEPTMVATIAALIGVCTACSALLVSNGRWRFAPLLPLAVGATVELALGAPARPSVWLLGAIGGLVLVFALAGDAGRRSARWSLDGTVLASIALIAVVGFASARVVAWSDRADPRDTTEAQVSEVLLTPIEATVAMRRTEPVVELATIRDRSPLARPTMPDRWRLAAFDLYDGQRWTPQLDLRPIGGRLDAAPTGSTAEVLVYGVQYHTDDTDLVPFPGRALSVDRDVETDLDRVAVRLLRRPDAATTIVAAALPSPSVGRAADVGLAIVDVDEVAAGFTEQARAIAGDGLRLEQVGRLASTMRDGWELDAQAPGAGQQLALIERFVADTRRGTREQFVTSFVLLARSLGFDARVAVGFRVPPEDLGSTFTLRSSHAAVWPEVRLSDGSWLPFDPVPPIEAIDAEQQPPPPEAQTPAAAQPPIQPPVESPDRGDDATLDESTNSDRWGVVRTWVIRVAAVGGVVLLPFVIAVAVIVLIKRWRWRRRLRTTDPVAQVRGIWANTTDALVDAGLAIAPSWTDDTIAERAADVVGGPTHEPRRLAAMASTVTFGTPGRDTSGRLAVDATATALAIDHAIRASRTRWERLRWRLSLRSLRRSTRSPVVP